MNREPTIEQLRQQATEDGEAIAGQINERITVALTTELRQQVESISYSRAVDVISGGDDGKNEEFLNLAVENITGKAEESKKKSDWYGE